MTSAKEYNYMVKGIVTRDIDPENKKRVQVYIPAYHGARDESKIGSDSDLGRYPWAQACVPVISSEGSESSDKGFWSSLFSNFTSNPTTKTSAAIVPVVNDVVWLTFEGGDISKPIIMGVLYSCVRGDIIPDTSVTTLTGGSLASLVASVMSANEGSYTSVNWNDNGATSIGKAQWRANRARNLLVKIKEKNVDSFNSIASSFNSILNTSWNTMVLSSGSTRGQQLKSLLATDASKQAQDELILADCQVYIDHGRSYGLTDAAAIIYYCDVENQWGQGGAADLGRNGGNSLDAIHKYAMEHKYGQYASRRNKTYAAIKQLIDSGKLSLMTACDIKGADQGGQLLFPTPTCQVITSYYGYRDNPTNRGNRQFHSGLDLAKNGGALGQPIVASHAGVISTQTTSGGYGILTKITNGNMVTYYAHQSKRADGIKDGVQVSAGQLIGYVGSTGNSTGPHLHYEVRVNGSTVNPLPYIKG